MTTLHLVELGVLGPLQVRRDGAPVPVPGAKPRAILTMLGLHGGAVVSAETFFELLWGEDSPRTAAKALQTHISSLRRVLGDGFVLTKGAGWALGESELDASRYRSAARLGRDAAAAGDISQAVACFEEALALWRGAPELPDGRRGTSEKTRWVEGHAALVEDRADALLATGRAAELIGDLEAAVADAPLRERRWSQLMLALYRAGRQGDALSAYQRARALLADELGIDPGPELRRLETAIVAQSAELEVVAAQNSSSVMRAVTFLLTDIEGSTAAWEAEADAMASALARHDELVEHVVTSRAGRLIKTRGEGDATFSVFERPSAAAAAAIELQDAIAHEPWTVREPIRIRVALHTGEVELRDGDYFGRAVNRAARLKSLAVGGQTLCSGATAELVIDSLPDHVMLADLGLRELRNLARPEHVFELRLTTAEVDAPPPTSDSPIERPGLPTVLIGTGPFVGRGNELERLYDAWQTALGGGARAALIAGEPGVGKTRLAGEWSRQAYEHGAVVLYGRCDEDLGAPYQPFAESLRSLVPCVGTNRLRGLRGVEALLSLVPGLTDVVPDLATPTRADPDTERYALFDAVVALLETASKEVPVVLVLDDLHWAAKPTLLLLRHVLRFGENARVQVVGTYRSTDLDRSHPLAAMLADLHRDGTSSRINLSGLDEDDVTAYVAKAGYDDEELGRALASVTGGNPFFLIEALRHVDESGGVWDPSTLPQGVREAVSRRLTRLPNETNKALAAAAVVGSRFALELVERVVGDDLVDAFDEAAKAGIVIEEPGGHYRFNHAIVRQSLLAELPSVRRMRLHQRIATTLEDESGDGDELLAELAHHYFECAWAGNAAKAVQYCRRAADQAMTRLAYEGAADLYGHALHAMDELDDELPDRENQVADLLVARCEALLAAGDVASAAGTVAQLQQATVDSARLSAWATCFDGQLSILVHPERLDDVEAGLEAAARKLAEIDDAAGEAKAHTVRAQCLARLGRIGDCEIALDDALTAARRARDHRRVNAVLAGAPLAALWGPNPVPRAGGRCLDVVRLLRITTDSPAVEAMSTRCQAVLEAFRGREAAARRMIESARRTVVELGLRHAFLEVEQFAGIVELVLDDPAAAEPHLRQAYNGFRRMGLDADTAETAALLGRACLALDRDTEADELCTESERLAGHVLKASIAWRTVRAQLLSRDNHHHEARSVAQAAIGLAERTDGLVDHGDACLSMATVLDAAGDAVGARAAAERAAELYERKGAAALAERARRIFAADLVSRPTAAEERPRVDPDTACVRAISRLWHAYDREAWDEVEGEFATEIAAEYRRKIVGFSPRILSPGDWVLQIRHIRAFGGVRRRHAVVAIRGERLALIRFRIGPADASPGAPHEELLHLYGLDVAGRIALHIAFDGEDLDAAMAELDAVHAQFEDGRSDPRRLENTATRVFERVWSHFAAGDWDAMAEAVSDSYSGRDHRRVVNAENQHGPDAVVTDLKAAADVGFTISMVGVTAIRGERLALARVRAEGRDPEAISNEALNVVEVDADARIARVATFDVEDFDKAIAELESRYIAGEAAAHAHTWSVVAGAYAALNRHEFPATTPDWVDLDHRGEAMFGPSDLTEYLRAGLDFEQDFNIYTEAVHRLTDLGVVVAYAVHATSQEGFEAEWRGVSIFVVEGDMLHRWEVFDEADVDAAIARFDQLSRPSPRLENTALRVFEQGLSRLAGRDWAAVAETVADKFSSVDHRRVVNAENQHGRADVVKDARVGAEIGLTLSIVSAMAIRGDRLVLARVRISGHDPETIQNDALNIIEIDAEDLIATVVVYDLEDFEAAIAELECRYLAGEAAPHARTWSAITGAFAALNRRELPATTSDWVNIDHRRGTSIAPGEMASLLDAAWDVTSDLSNFIDVVHRLDDFGAVISHVANETSAGGFHAEWRVVSLVTLDGELVNRCEVFDEADLDAAIARFDQLSRPTPQLENTASRNNARYLACFNARDWDTMASMLADDFYSDDRRRITGIGTRRGREAEIENLRVIAGLGGTVTAEVIATRGDRLVVSRNRVLVNDQQQEFLAEALLLIDTDLDGRVAATIMFDPEAFEAAFEDLDARYLVGEAAAHARTWTVIGRGFAALNRGEVPAMTQGFVNDDHRHAASMAPGEGIAYFHASWELAADLNVRIEAVHRLSDLGAVFTHVGKGTSRDGFEAEWRAVELMTVEGDLISRGELFDETDVDAALAKFEQLSRPTPRLENTASRVDKRFQGCFAARDWEVMAEMLSDGFSTEDRRRVVNMGNLIGRDAELTVHAYAVGGTENVASTVVATRGQRLALSHYRFSGSDERPDAFRVEMLVVVEIDAEERMAAVVVFDADEIDAAIAELDARYLAGEAADHARTWAVVSSGFASISRYELPPTTPDCVSIDHRRMAAFGPGELNEYFRAAFDLTADVRIYVEAVHRLNDAGVVCTHVTHGVSHEGFAAEWREVNVLMVEGDTVGRCELFDEADLDDAVAKFSELSLPTRRLENLASRVAERYWKYFGACQWDAMAEIIANNFVSDDRRRVVGAGSQHGPEAAMEDIRVISDIWLRNVATTVIAIRGQRLALMRIGISSGEHGPEPFVTEVLAVGEIDADERLVAGISFDVDDIDAAIQELDSRYLAGEAAAHSHAWSVVAASYAALNRQEIPPTTPDCVNIDHRRETAFGPADLIAYQNAGLKLARGINVFVAAVHRLNGSGSVITYAAHETLQQGFEAEWRGIAVLIIDGDLINRVEVFDEGDLHAALARFDELQPRVPRLENAVSQVDQRFWTHFAARDWDAVAEVLADDICTEDRRRVVNAGVRHGLDSHIAEMRAVAEVGLQNVTSTIVATRGSRLALARICGSIHAIGTGELDAEVLNIVEIDAEERISGRVGYDTDDIAAAFEQLDARYLAGEAAPYAKTWTAVVGAYLAFNRHEIPAAPDWVNVDHRRGTTVGPGDMAANIRATWDVAPNITRSIEAVHRLNNLGAVVTRTSREGFDAEWREVSLLTFQAGSVNHFEIFDEADLDAALARFDELDRG